MVKKEKCGRMKRIVERWFLSAELIPSTDRTAGGIVIFLSGAFTLLWFLEKILGKSLGQLGKKVGWGWTRHRSWG